MDEFVNWCEALVYAAGPGVSVIVGAVLSVLVEFWPKFGGLDGRIKRLVFLGLNLVVPLIAAGLGVASCDWPATWAGTYWPALVAGIVGFASGTTVHIAWMGRKKNGSPSFRASS